MNRKQAEHILDAYRDMHRECGEEDECTTSLREVILDAMTTYKAVSYPTITVPNVTQPTPNYIKPIVTC